MSPGASAPRQRLVDLHAHSTASDGSATPIQLVETAFAAGLAAVAITDHDTIAGVDEAASTGERLGLRVVPGLELSSEDEQGEVHLLALHLTHTAALEQRLELLRDQRFRRAEAIVAKLRQLGFPVDISDVLRESAGGAVGRPHIARALVRTGRIKDVRSAFDQYLGAGRPAYVPRQKLSVRDAVSIAHDAGALTFWAHPGVNGTRSRLESMMDAGVDGVEVLHPSHYAEDIRRLKTLATHFRILTSGGSDWHGAADGARSLGSMRVPAELLDAHDRAREARAAARS